MKIIQRNMMTLLLYLITAPLGEKINYEYEENVIVVLSPGHKIIFLDLACRAEFDEYFDDFISDLGALSNKYKVSKLYWKTTFMERRITTKMSNQGWFYQYRKVIC